MSFKQQRDGKAALGPVMPLESKEKGLWFVKHVGKGTVKGQEGRGTEQRDEPMPRDAL